MRDTARCSLGLAALVLTFVGAEAPAFAGSYTYGTVSLPGQTSSAASGINNRNEVIGNIAGPSGGGFLLTSGGLTMLAHGGVPDSAGAINQKGEVAGNLGSDAAAVFLYRPATGGQRAIRVSPGNTVRPVALNDSAVIGGSVYSPGSQTVIGFLAAGGSVTAVLPPNALGASVVGVNDHGIAAGNYSDVTGASHGFIYTGGPHVIGAYTTIDVPNVRATYVNAITADGTLAGSYIDGNHKQHGFIRRGSNLTVVDYPGADDTTVVGLTKSGAVIGNVFSGGVSIGFVLVDGKFSQIGAPGAGVSTTIAAVNANGSFAGVSFTGSDYYHPTAVYGICRAADAPCTQ